MNEEYLDIAYKAGFKRGKQGLSAWLPRHWNGQQNDAYCNGYKAGWQKRLAERTKRLALKGGE